MDLKVVTWNINRNLCKDSHWVELKGLVFERSGENAPTLIVLTECAGLGKSPSWVHDYQDFGSSAGIAFIVTKGKVTKAPTQPELNQARIGTWAIEGGGMISVAGMHNPKTDSNEANRYLLSAQHLLDGPSVVAGDFNMSHDLGRGFRHFDALRNKLCLKSAWHESQVDSSPGGEEPTLRDYDREGKASGKRVFMIDYIFVTRHFSICKHNCSCSKAKCSCGVDEMELIPGSWKNSNHKAVWARIALPRSDQGGLTFLLNTSQRSGAVLS